MKLSSRARLWGVLLCVLVAAGCASLAELSNLSSRIQDKGYTGISVRHQTSNGVDTLAVAAYNLDQKTDDGETIFRLVWDTYPEEVDRVVVTVNDQTRSATEEELRKAFGARNIQPVGDSGSSTAVVWVILIAFLILTTVITTVAVRRRRRRIGQVLPMPPYPQGPYQQP